MPVRIPCNNLHWVLKDLKALNINAQQLLRDTGVTQYDFLYNNAHVDWRVFSTMLGNLFKIVAPERFEYLGKRWVYESDLQYVLYLNDSASEAYEHLFRPSGWLMQEYPCATVFEQSGHTFYLTLLERDEMPDPVFERLLSSALQQIGEFHGRSTQVTRRSSDVGRTFVVKTRPSLLRSVVHGMHRRTPSKVRSRIKALVEQVQNKSHRIYEDRDAARDEESVWHEILDTFTSKNDSAVWVVDKQYRLIFANHIAHRIMAPTLGETKGQPMVKIWPEWSQIAKLGTFNQVAAGNHGRYRYRFAPFSHGFVLHGSKVADQRTDDHTARRFLVEWSSDAVVELDDIGSVVHHNAAAEALLGVASSEDLHGSPLVRFIPTLGQLTMRFDEGERTPLRCIGFTADKRLLSLSVLRRESTWILFDEDAQEAREREKLALQDQLSAAQRVDSLGHLAGGIAHDLNNLLTIVNGYTDLAQGKELAEESRSEYLKEVLFAGHRAAELSAKLLTIGRQQPISTEFRELNPVLKGAKSLLSRLMPANITLTLNTGLTNLSANVDALQIEQVIMNLATNARDALPDGGEITISVAEEFIDHLPVRSDRFIVIRVRDTGVGIPPDTQQRLFEPFFTTKPPGQGTGLGLPVVKNIVEQHDGFIDVDSTPGQGTSFNVYLPFTIRPPKAAVRRNPPIEDLSGDEYLMVVDTSRKTRELIRLMLTTVGYHIFDATDPEDALIVYRDCWDVAEMVLMDVTLPDPGAEALMYQLMELNPDVKILFTSAYGPTAEITRFVVDAGMYFVPRPYTADMLRRMVRTVLDNPVINPKTFLPRPQDTHEP